MKNTKSNTHTKIINPHSPRNKSYRVKDAAIVAAILSHPKEHSVRAISCYAGINTASFYHHYSDVPSVMGEFKRTVLDEFAVFLGSLPDAASPSRT